ncbi:MAG: tRNA preQ1(34) S-adenosylmethionine ribosyltransferase-isomerase QueA [Brevinemataceae bacterium]
MKYFLDFNLPESLIATVPSKSRDGDRMIYYQDGQLEHDLFVNIAGYVNPGDLIIFNNSKVLKARLKIISAKNGFISELLLVLQQDLYTWSAMIKKAKRFKLGDTLVLENGTKGVITDILEDGLRIIRFDIPLSPEYLDQIGQIPLPPYIIEERKKRGQTLYSQDDEERYQTLFAKYYGSVAAPTASLRFSERVISELKDKGVHFEEITLHVGIGTFKPMDKDPELFEIHRERIEVSQNTIERIKQTKKQGGRVIAAGTTVCRALESAGFDSKNDWTDIFIKPSYEFQIVDGLITNFHLPYSTLLLLVQAFIGIEQTKQIYMEALDKKYRFFSYGDGMILFR